MIQQRPVKRKQWSALCASMHLALSEGTGDVEGSNPVHNFVIANDALNYDASSFQYLLNFCQLENSTMTVFQRPPDFSKWSQAINNYTSEDSICLVVRVRDNHQSHISIGEQQQQQQQASAPPPLLCLEDVFALLHTRAREGRGKVIFASSLGLQHLASAKDQNRNSFNNRRASALFPVDMSTDTDTDIKQLIGVIKAFQNACKRAAPLRGGTTNIDRDRHHNPSPVLYIQSLWSHLVESVSVSTSTSVSSANNSDNINDKNVGNSNSNSNSVYRTSEKTKTKTKSSISLFSDSDLSISSMFMALFQAENLPSWLEALQIVSERLPYLMGVTVIDGTATTTATLEHDQGHIRISDQQQVQNLYEIIQSILEVIWHIQTAAESDQHVNSNINANITTFQSYIYRHVSAKEELSSVILANSGALFFQSQELPPVSISLLKRLANLCLYLERSNVVDHIGPFSFERRPLAAAPPPFPDEMFPITAASIHLLVFVSSQVEYADTIAHLDQWRLACPLCCLCVKYTLLLVDTEDDKEEVGGEGEEDRERSSKVEHVKSYIHINYRSVLLNTLEWIEHQSVSRDIVVVLVGLKAMQAFHVPGDTQAHAHARMGLKVGLIPLIELHAKQKRYYRFKYPLLFAHKIQNQKEVSEAGSRTSASAARLERHLSRQDSGGSGSGSGTGSKPKSQSQEQSPSISEVVSDYDCASNIDLRAFMGLADQIRKLIKKTLEHPLTAYTNKGLTSFFQKLSCQYSVLDVKREIFDLDLGVGSDSDSDSDSSGNANGQSSSWVEPFFRKLNPPGFPVTYAINTSIFFLPPSHANSSIDVSGFIYDRYDYDD